MNKSYKWVVKAGSSLVSGNEDGVNIDFISQLASQIDFLRKNNQEVIVISSGAVAKGMNDLGIKKRPDQLAILQACAAVGQRGISEIYQNTFEKFGYTTGQVLISHDDIANRTRYLNAKNSIEALLDLGVIPIVNENDCVATEEISFGDNDRLGAALAGLIRADRFVMLTDQDGIFNDDPTKNHNAQLLDRINLDDENLDLSQILNSTSGVLGRGGMKTKIEAARTSLNSGAMTWVASGLKDDTLLKIFKEEFDQISQHYNKILNFYGAWSASYDKGDYHIPHNHGSIGHCGILYLDMHKKSPATCYLQPWNNDKDRSVIYEPEAEEGDIVIIPQHIVHFTRPNPVSFKKRIISFDFKL